MHILTSFLSVRSLVFSKIDSFTFFYVSSLKKHVKTIYLVCTLWFALTNQSQTTSFVGKSKKQL